MKLAALNRALVKFGVWTWKRRCQVWWPQSWLQQLLQAPQWSFLTHCKSIGTRRRTRVSGMFVWFLLQRFYEVSVSRTNEDRCLKVVAIDFADSGVAVRSQYSYVCCDFCYGQGKLPMHMGLQSVHCSRSTGPCFGFDLRRPPGFQHQTLRFFSEFAKKEVLFAIVSRKLDIVNHQNYTI